MVFDNVKNGETVHQRCLLVTGHLPAPDHAEADYVVVSTTDPASGYATFPSQRWPLCQGWFKALVILSPGANKVTVDVGHVTAPDITDPYTVTLNYTPLLQTPPLHLAILVAKDSPLLLDCPPSKHGAVSSAHASLDAAVAKLRTAAYMWQALTAEELRGAGLDRRAFRLEEEWGVETLSKEFAEAVGTGGALPVGAMGSTAKVHLIRAHMTVAEIRDADLAQQNEGAKRRDELHSIFREALLAHGGPFVSGARPVVAGLILDAHFDPSWPRPGGKGLIRAHAALGAYDDEGLSLGIFGSHLCYSWPRFFEEVASCLLDMTPPGDRVGNDNDECATMWEACAVGQGAMLHEVGHAFSAPHTTGIMARGYSPDWPRCFLSRTARCVHRDTGPIEPVRPGKTPNECKWDVRDMLRFANQRHFALPGDPPLADPWTVQEPTLKLYDEEDEVSPAMVISASGRGGPDSAGIAQIYLNGKLETGEGYPSIGSPARSFRYTAAELEARGLGADKLAGAPLELEVLGINGRHRTCADVWKFLTGSKSYVRVPGAGGLRLLKKSVRSDRVPEGPQAWEWAVMLKKRPQGYKAGKSDKAGGAGELVLASKVDLRVGSALDGAVVHYRDGTSVPCGPRGGTTARPQDPGMGGHQARKMALPHGGARGGGRIVKVGVAVGTGWDHLGGLRMWLANGKAMGALNSAGGRAEYLEPDEGQKVVGFYGVSGRDGMCFEFGIITAPEAVELPDAVYDMPELINSPEGGAGWRPKTGAGAPKDKGQDEEEDEQSDSDEYETSEDEDWGYDNDEDQDEEDEEDEEDEDEY